MISSINKNNLFVISKVCDITQKKIQFPRGNDKISSHIMCDPKKKSYHRLKYFMQGSVNLDFINKKKINTPLNFFLCNCDRQHRMIKTSEKKYNFPATTQIRHFDQLISRIIS